MSDVTTEQRTSDTRPTLVRTFEPSIEVDADGRNLELLCAPFDVATEVADPPDWQPYLEAFERGAFAGATRAPNRVLLDFEHDRGMSGLLGHAAELREESGGLYGRFRVTEHPDGDKALSLVREGILTRCSVAFAPLRSRRSGSGVVQRMRVHLDRVSLCRVGAYSEAQVLAVRTAPLVEQVPDLGEELRARLEAKGIVLAR